MKRNTLKQSQMNTESQTQRGVKKEEHYVFVQRSTVHISLCNTVPF